MKVKLSNTSKMPCKSWGIPEKDCITGKKLAKIENSVCSGCYAGKGAYRWSNVKRAYQVRLDQFNKSRGQWEDSMMIELKKEAKRQLKTEKQAYFRWFDSGDLQSLDMLESIIRIAYNASDIKFWLPTREVRIVINYLKKWGANSIPSNLTIRFSDMMINQDTKYTGNQAELIRQAGILFSGVSTDENKVNCHSFKQHGKCLACRACWDKSVKKVIYLKH